MTIKLLKLVTGEEVLVTVTSESSSELEIQDAVVVFPANNAQGGLSLNFVPWTLTMFSEDDKAMLSKEHILATCNANTEIIDRYKKMFGLDSGLVIPETPSIILS